MDDASIPKVQPVRPELYTGDLGSQVLTLKTDNARDLLNLVECFEGGFRKFWYDLVGGIAEFMSPTPAHEFTSRDARDTIVALCHDKGIAVVDMGSTTISTPEQTGAGLPDESFLIGARAERYLQIEARDGEAAAIASIEGEPPDLAVEVEHTSHQRRKISLYRECGVKELWDLATGSAKRAPTVYDLQAENGPKSRPDSRILPGVRADRLSAAAAELRVLGGLIALGGKRARGELTDDHLVAIASAPGAKAKAGKTGTPSYP